MLRKYLGCVVVDATIEAAQENVVSVSLTVALADIVPATTAQSPSCRSGTP